MAGAHDVARVGVVALAEDDLARGEGARDGDPGDRARSSGRAPRRRARGEQLDRLLRRSRPCAGQHPRSGRVERALAAARRPRQPGARRAPSAGEQRERERTASAISATPGDDLEHAQASRERVARRPLAVVGPAGRAVGVGDQATVTVAQAARLSTRRSRRGRPLRSGVDVAQARLDGLGLVRVRRAAERAQQAAALGRASAGARGPRRSRAVMSCEACGRSRTCAEPRQPASAASRRGRDAQLEVPPPPLPPADARRRRSRRGVGRRGGCRPRRR